MLSIDKKLINPMPLATFSGTTHVINNAADAKQAVAYLAKQKIIGFDTETRPSFRKKEYHKMALIQLATVDECFLFRINLMGLTTPLINLLENPKVLKVGLSTRDDMHGLNQIAPCQPQGMIELQQFVKQYDIADLSLQKIYAIVFGQHISKRQQTSNWEAKTLSPEQIAYAALDAWACLHIYNSLTNGEFDPSTSPYIIQPDGQTSPQQ